MPEIPAESAVEEAKSNPTIAELLKSDRPKTKIIEKIHQLVIEKLNKDQLEQASILAWAMVKR